MCIKILIVVTVVVFFSPSSRVEYCCAIDMALLTSSAPPGHVIQGTRPVSSISSSLITGLQGGL